MQPTDTSNTTLLQQFLPPVPMLTRLRALIPTHNLSLTELLALIDLQASNLLAFSDTSQAPTPCDVITKLPSIRLAETQLPLSGYSYWNGHQWIVSINRDEARERQRFTLMHEFAHITWHGHEHHLFAHLSPAAARHLAELAANYFAGAVLLPRHLLLHAWHRGNRNVNQLAAMFQVSAETVTIGLAQIGLTDCAAIDIPFLRPPRRTRAGIRVPVQRSFTPPARQARTEVAA